MRCPVCGSPMQQEKPWLYHCPSCKFLGSTLEPGGGTGIDGLERLRRANFELLLDRLQRLCPLAGARILEIGPAKGWFLEAALRRGAAVHGIEPEAINAQACRNRGLPVETGFFPADLKNRGPFDIIAFNDVFEHIPEPASLIREVAALLDGGGLAVINLPSSRGTLFQTARLVDRLGASGLHERMWQKGLPSPHISYFSPGNLEQLAVTNASLRPADRFSLPSVSRDGLYARIRSSHGAVASALLCSGVWALSFALPALPADIEVSVFRKTGR